MEMLWTYFMFLIKNVHKGCTFPNFFCDDTSSISGGQQTLAAPLK